MFLCREDEYLVNMQHTVIPSWYQREGYIKAMASLIEAELKKFKIPEKVGFLLPDSLNMKETDNMLGLVFNIGEYT